MDQKDRPACLSQTELGYRHLIVPTLLILVNEGGQKGVITPINTTMKTKAKPKEPTPKRLWVRRIENGKKFSVGEYVRAKWRNAVDPFRTDDTAALHRLAGVIALFEKHEKRKVVFIGYGGSGAAEELHKLIRGLK